MPISQDHLVVERAPDQSPRQLSAEILDSVLSLKGHPGWEYLLGKLRYQRQCLRARLEQEAQPDLTSVNSIRHAIAWAGWLESQMLYLGATHSERPSFTPTPTEEEMFREIAASITMVGTSSE